MAEFTATDVAALRKATGAGMMDCKKALEETGGDIEAAKDWLRKKGLAGAASAPGARPTRARSTCVVEGGVGAIVELDRRDRLRRQGRRLHRDGRASSPSSRSRRARTSSPSSRSRARTVGEHVTQLAAQARRERRARPGRRVRDHRRPARRLQARPERPRARSACSSSSAASTRADAKAQEVAHDIALHIASAAPRYADRATTCRPTWSRRSGRCSRS